MFFIYGGGFNAGTQMKMGYERIGDFSDVVLVAINYRLGPFGNIPILSHSIPKTPLVYFYFS